MADDDFFGIMEDIEQKERDKAEFHNVHKQKFSASIDKDERKASSKVNSINLNQSKLQENSGSSHASSIKEDLNFIDESYFKPAPQTSDRPEKKKITVSQNDDLNFIDNAFFNRSEGQPSSAPLPFQDVLNSGLHHGKEESIDRGKKVVKPRQGNERRETAAKFIKQFRLDNNINLEMNPGGSSSKKKFDSLGFRVPNEQKFNFKYMTEQETGLLLYKCVLANTEEVVALNKPYGISTHIGPVHQNNVAKVLPHIAQQLRHDGELHLVHRLDKDTTGIMLLAKNRSMAHVLKEAFKKRWILKSYLCIVCGVPFPDQGIIDIPIKEVQVSPDIHKMVLRPHYFGSLAELPPPSSRLNEPGEANTFYSVLDAVGCAALVECRPATGVTHQIRVHLASALNTPVLGDHKYSHKDRLAPQRLSQNLLKTLAIRQSKARHLSLHLHAHRIAMGSGVELATSTTPPPADLPVLNFRAPLPAFFAENMRRLRLAAPRLLNVARSRII